MSQVGFGGWFLIVAWALSVVDWLLRNRPSKWISGYVADLISPGSAEELRRLTVENAALEEQHRRARAYVESIRAEAEAYRIAQMGDPYKSCHAVVCEGRGQHPCHDLDCRVHDLDFKRKMRARG